MRGSWRVQLKFESQLSRLTRVAVSEITGANTATRASAVLRTLLRLYSIRTSDNVTCTTIAVRSAEVTGVEKKLQQGKSLYSAKEILALRATQKAGSA